MAFIEHKDFPGGGLNCSPRNVIKIMLTPSLAKFCLERNYEGQRQINDSHIARYAAELSQDTWHWNTTGIGFLTDGKMCDGQHRCEAVIKTGVSIETFAVTGLTPEDYATLDGGKKRSTADLFRACGIPNAIDASALALKVYLLDCGCLIRSAFSNNRWNASATNDAILDKWFEKAEQLSGIVRSTRLFRKRLGDKGAPTAIGVAFYLCEEYGYGDALSFEKALADQDDITALKTTTAITLKLADEKIQHTWLVGTILQGYEAYSKGNTIGARGGMNKQEQYINKYDERIRKIHPLEAEEESGQ